MSENKTGDDAYARRIYSLAERWRTYHNINIGKLHIAGDECHGGKVEQDKGDGECWGLAIC